MTFCLFIVILGCLRFQQSLQETHNKPLVTVFYEPLCPFSRRFITDILYPIYPKLGSRIHLDFVPYGIVSRQQVGDSWTFDCQHGPEECAISKLQACGIARTYDQDLQMEYIYCIQKKVDTTTDINLLAKCADKLQLLEDEILDCAKGTEGDELFSILGDKQHLLAPSLHEVPTVYINDEILDDESTLKQTLCHMLNNEPEECKTQE